MVARLVWEAARGTMEFPLANTATVGREEDADIQIQEPLVSRLHARLERRGEAWFVIDLGSTNLTRVNGTVIREKELHPGDEVQFARAKCRFLIGAAAEQQPPAPAQSTVPTAPRTAEDDPASTDGATPIRMPAPTGDSPSS